MGSSASVPLAESAPLHRLVSPEPLPPGHPFWNVMLSFQKKTPNSRSGWHALESSLEELLKRFTVNNLKSGNFGAAVDIFLRRQQELLQSVETDSSLFLWQTFNALFILRVAVKFFLERLKDDDVQRQFAATAAQPAETATAEMPTTATMAQEVDPGRRYEAFVQALIDIAVEIPLEESTYGLHTETLQMLTILLSSPLFLSKPAFQMHSYRLLMTSPHAAALTRTLLTHYSQQTQAPASYLSDDDNGGGSIVLGLASGVWNILTLGYNSVAASQEAAEGAAGESGQAVSTKPLADSALMLLLVLTNHCTDSTASALTNPYRQCLFACTHVSDTPPAAVDASTTKTENAAPEAADAAAVVAAAAAQPPPPPFSIDFGQLFKTLCANLSSDESTLLLYLLLHQNLSFRSHVHSSSDIERLVLPILVTLYHAPDSNNHHIYMSLIVLLILSEDDLFNTSVHDVTMKKHVEWYTERALSDISLGGLLILVVIRTIQYNMLKMRDKYLHTNCLAALANMSSQFKNLHPYVSQRIVSMFEALAKKHARLVATLRQAGELDPDDDSSPVSEAISDAAVLEEVLRMILEIVNSCLVHQFKNNSNLIYTLLYKRELFEPFCAHPAFKDISQNLNTVIVYFHSKLEQIQEKKERTLAVHEVQEVIRQTAMQFPREKLTKFPDLKFKYVEEPEPEDFFVPYVWTLATNKIYWNPDHIKLFGKT